MNHKESDSESEAEIHRGGRTAVDILRAPLELPRPVRRPPNVKHPVLSAPCKTSKYKPGAEFSTTFWKVVRELRLEEETKKITITELEDSPRHIDDESGRFKLSSDSDSSEGGLASGETSSSEDEKNVYEKTTNNDFFICQNNSESPVKHFSLAEECVTKTKTYEYSSSELDSD